MTELDVNGSATAELLLRTPGWARASDDEIAERDALAAAVVAALRAAGCPADLAHRDTDRDRGYYVEVDAGADFAGGVFVMWAPGGTVGRAAKDAVLRHDYTHPAIKFHGEVAHAMTTAALHVLHAAGFTAVLADDDEHPYELDVRAGSLDAVNWHL